MCRKLFIALFLISCQNRFYADLVIFFWRLVHKPTVEAIAVPKSAKGSGTVENMSIFPAIKKI
jgi:hypothetical protein